MNTRPRLRSPLISAAAALVSACACLGAQAQATAPSQGSAMTAPPQPVAEADWTQSIGPLVQPMSLAAAQAAMGPRTPVRVEVIPGTLDPRLRLAPCRRIQPFLPPGHKAWGRTRMGLRCVEGAVAWSVTLPLTVRVFAPALVAGQPLVAGTVLEAQHLQLAEVDWAAADSAAQAQPAALVGRTLARPVVAGQAVRDADLRRRQWFAMGDTVQIVAVGPGFAVSGEGVALTPGLEGQVARIRTENGRTVSGVAVGERRLEVNL